MRIAIVGAGLTGLSCARVLKDHAEVVLFEGGQVGGLASSYCTSRYCIERFYHHCFRWDRDLIELAEKLNVKIVWRLARTGYAFGGKIYPLNTPIEILRFPYLTIKDKIRLAIFTLKSRRRNYDREDRSVVEGIREELGENLLRNFFMPLLKAKFGDTYENVSYAWLIARVAIRSNRKLRGEELGYVRGGFHVLIEKMKRGLEIVERRVEKIEPKNGGFLVDGEFFDTVIYTAPLPTLDPKIRVMAGLPEVKYQSSVCALLGAERSVTEDIYWTNVADSKIFGAIVEHTNFMPFEDYGEHVIYLASYSTPNGWLFKLDDSKLKELYLRELERFGLRRRYVNWIEIFKAKYSGPIYEVGYRTVDYRTRLRGFYVAGMVSPPNYPERSMNGSIRAGKEVARIVLNSSEDRAP